jgi:hypothetical protein
MQPRSIPRDELPARVRVEQQRDHHRRVVRRPPVTVVPVDGVEHGQVHLGDRGQHEPRKMILGQPLPHARRQQQLLIAITRKEVLGHHRIVLN